MLSTTKQLLSKESEQMDTILHTKYTLYLLNGVHIHTYIHIHTY